MGNELFWLKYTGADDLLPIAMMCKIICKVDCEFG